ncbi:hypothetical protein GCM10027563_11590 [Parasphingorhabdus pacifica]
MDGLWETLWEQVSGPISLVDVRGHIVAANPAMCRMLGYSREELLALTPPDVTHPDDSPLDRAAIERFVASGTDSYTSEKRLVRSDGRVIWVLINGSLLRAPNGDPQVVVTQFHDITTRRESEQLWRQTLVNAPIGMALIDLDGRWTEINDRFCELLGYRREQVLAHRFSEIVYSDDAARAEALFAELRQGHVDTGSLEICVRHREGHPFWLLVRLSVVRHADESPAYLVSQYESLGSDAHVGEERLATLTHMALHDPLTDLANRALLIDRFEQELAGLPERGGVLTVLAIDIDDFKEVNDRFGHGTGDQVLQATAKDLLSVVRSTDTVARVGGDEFVVLSRLADQSQAEELRLRVEHRLAPGSDPSGRSIRPGASVGMATTDDPSSHSRTLLDCADHDMYARKRVKARKERPGRPLPERT